ncbi:putative toxin-antitoxin system toxin component, PIN family [Eubacterium uniforme]|uniref:putative toxin-antitoxin system toxin component, PIN family n=1 Tax=Eubacterium uniforme TaxID=39495 RepID=UPI0013566F5F|nr:putative toxin-antitoxin system toxin component, PIN family [Eubacterium uniforme]
MKVFAVVDTNVLISSVLSNGAPHDILELIQNQNVIPVFDKRMLNEYYKVFHYDSFKGLDEDIIVNVLYDVISNGIMVNDIEHTKMVLKDKDDIPFFEVKENSKEFSTYLVTGNLKHYPKDAFIIDSRMFLSIIGYLDRFVGNRFVYEENIKRIIETNVIKPKYSLGKEMLNDIFCIKEKLFINEEYFNKSINSDEPIKNKGKSR